MKNRNYITGAFGSFFHSFPFLVLKDLPLLQFQLVHHPFLCLLSVTSAFIKKTVFKPVIKLNSLSKFWQVLAPQKDRDTSTYMATYFSELKKKTCCTLGQYFNKPFTIELFCFKDSIFLKFSLLYTQLTISGLVAILSCSYTIFQSGQLELTVVVSLCKQSCSASNDL